MIKTYKVNNEMLFLWPSLSVPLIRIGPCEDGGYVLPKDIYQNTSQLLSFGVNVDWRFERSLFDELEIPVELYEAQSVLRLIVRYFAGGIVKKLLGRASWALVSERLSRTIDYFVFFSKSNVNLHRQWIDGSSAKAIFRSCHQNCLFKCDIEGGEYEILQYLVNEQQKFNIITIEFHEVNDNLSRIKEFICDISEQFYLIHFHANNTSRVSVFGVPDVLELTFSRVNSQMVVSEPPLCLPIHGVDYPSASNQVDYEFLKP